MISKVFFATLVLLVACELALADPLLCPDSSTAKNLVHKEEFHEDAPSFGRTQKVLHIPSAKSPSCITLIGHASAGPSGYISIAGISVTEDGVDVKLVSAIQTGMDGEIAVYSE